MSASPAVWSIAKPRYLLCQYLSIFSINITPNFTICSRMRNRLQQLRLFHRRCRRHQQEAQVARQRGWCEICFRDENFAELSLLQMVIDTYKFKNSYKKMQHLANICQSLTAH